MRRQACFGLAVACAVGLVLSLPCFFAPLFDDAYIHLRIAAQLIRTGAPAFNPGVVLKTDSSTGYLLLLSGATWLSGHGVLALRSLQAWTVVAYAAQLYRLAVALNGRLRAVHALLLVSALPPVLWAAYGGMETSTAVLCLLSCALASIQMRYFAALLYASMAACLRLELCAFALYYAGWTCFVDGRSARLLFALFPLLACLLFDALAYRSILPHAALAKSLVYDLPFLEAARLALSVSFEQHVLWLGLLYASSLALFLRVRWRNRSAEPIVDGLTLQCALLLAAWASSRSIMFPWYVATFAGSVSVIALFSTRSAATARAHALSICALQVALGCLAACAVRIDLGGSRRELASGVRAQRYLTIGTGLSASCARCTLLASEIGGLGYGFRGTVFDAIGLADRAALRFHPLRVPAERASYRVGAIPPAYVALRAPDFVVSMPLFSEAFRASPVSRRFVSYDCPLVPEQPARALWGDTVIQIFAKKAIAPALLTRMHCAPP
jgi:hypothetical protein